MILGSVVLFSAFSFSISFIHKSVSFSFFFKRNIDCCTWGSAMVRYARKYLFALRRLIGYFETEWKKKQTRKKKHTETHTIYIIRTGIVQKFSTKLKYSRSAPLFATRLLFNMYFFLCISFWIFLIVVGIFPFEKRTVFFFFFHLVRVILWICSKNCIDNENKYKQDSEE